MKKMLSFMLAVMLIFAIPVYGSAAENQMETIYFEDGSYMTVEIITMGTRASGSVTGSRPYTYYGSDGTAQWKAILTGSFTYTGSSSTCTSSSVDVTIYDTNWDTVSKSASKSGNTAYGSATMGNRSTGSQVPVNLSLSCDSNGKLS